MALTRGRHQFQVVDTTTSFTAKDVAIFDVKEGEDAILEAHVFCRGGGRKYFVLRSKAIGDAGGVILQSITLQKIVYESPVTGGATLTTTGDTINVEVSASGTSLHTWEITVIAMVS